MPQRTINRLLVQPQRVSRRPVAVTREKKRHTTQEAAAAECGPEPPAVPKGAGEEDATANARRRQRPRTAQPHANAVPRRPTQ